MQDQLGLSIEWVTNVRQQGKALIQAQGTTHELPISAEAMAQQLLNHYLRPGLHNTVLLEGYKYITKYMDQKDQYLFWIFSACLKDSRVVNPLFKNSAGILNKDGFYELQDKDWQQTIDKMFIQPILFEERLEQVVANCIMNYQTALNIIGAAWMAVFCNQQHKLLSSIAQKENVSLHSVRQMASLKSHHMPALLENIKTHLMHPDLFLMNKPFSYYWSQFSRLDHNFGRILEFHRYPALLKYTDMMLLICLGHPTLEEQTVSTLKQTGLLQYLQTQFQELQKYVLEAGHLVLLDHLSTYLHALHKAHPRSPLMDQLMDHIWYQLYRLLQRYLLRLVTRFPSGPSPASLQPLANLLRRQHSPYQPKRMAALGLEIEQMVDILRNKE